MTWLLFVGVADCAACFDAAFTTLLPTVTDVDDVILPLKASVTGRVASVMLVG